ncbi:sugar phosphate isomerase/epimerase family protein [Anaerotalea alkaliphila]|uniref:TIM barrel protein n=1 Tax=Anaerotalea alkaliphila TaxID=2662126 RepID=A0A7X5HW16_9FIRM|nr:sugar phosphate isomerase/epimerase [Anaerotalea alkaliphila]NDL67496.1 TIM barrel protein [Anaerotalea alkaliphila]
MDKGKIGVQMMMLAGKVKELGVYETMRRLHDMGYRCVEVSQIPMTQENVSELKRACGDFGMEVAALSASVEPMYPGAPGETLADDFDKIVADCKTLDCSYLRIGMLPFSYMGDKDAVLAFTGKAEAYAQRLAAEGIDLYYHNHHVEFEKYGGKYLLDIMKDSTSRLGFELDVHWIQRGGENPVEFIKRYAGRISLLHLKDYRIGKFDASKVDMGDMAAFMAAFTGTVEFAEVGEGNLDMKAIIEAGLAAGSRYFLIEQDNQYGRDPFDCLQTSKDNLEKLGYGAWF